jgi:branched-chain amino acid transport system substrate-binding protein
MDKFLREYKDRFGEEVKGPAPYAFDALNLLVDAMVRAGSPDPSKYLPMLAKTDGYDGVTGSISFDEKGDIRNGALTLYTFRGNRRDAIAVIR